MEKIALFPGSFDPFTVGHESLVERARPLFDKIIIAVGINHEKAYFFPLEKRIHWISELFNDEPKIEVMTYEGLTVDFCDHVNATYLLRGLRTSADFEFERAIGQMNNAIHPKIESIFLLSHPIHTFISSSIVRDVYKHGGDIQSFLPKGMNLDL